MDVVPIAVALVFSGVSASAVAASDAVVAAAEPHPHLSEVFGQLMGFHRPIDRPTTPG